MRRIFQITGRGTLFLAIASMCVLTLTSLHADAAINQQINFQGKLTNPNGTNVTNGSYSIQFSIYTVASGGTSVWTETQGSVAVSDGIFRVALGSVTSLPGSVDFNSSALFLGIKVGADSEMTPRVQFTAAPYAFNSDRLGGIASSGFAQLGLSTAQVEASTNALIFLNKTSTGNLLQLQQAGTDRFLVNNSGILTTASVNSSSIVDGTVTNTDLVNSSLSVLAGNGLIDGGSVSLGGTTTLNIGAGTGITVAADAVGVTADGLNFTELADALSLDAATTISLGANNFTTNLSGTGDYAIQFGGNTIFQVLDTGVISIGSALANQTIGIDNGTGAINIATDANANSVSIGTGTGADTVTIGDSNANVSIGDSQWSISAAGAANFASTTGSGLTDCDTSSSKLLWDSATGLFSCGTDRASASVRKSANQTVTSSTTLVDDSQLLFAAGTNQTWAYQVSYIYTTGSSGTPDIRVGMNGPTGATCVYQVSDIAHAGNVAAGSTACNTAITVATTATATKGGILTGSVTTSTTAGNVVFRWAQGTSNATGTVVVAGSSLFAFRIDGADYAETYYSTDYTIDEGMIVEIAGNGRSQVLKGKMPYSDKQIGIVSTKPASVIGEADGSGKMLPVAMNGRVPIKLSTENGLPKAGDMITVSESMPGYGMVANKSGYIVGQMLMDAEDNGDGTADGYVYVRHGYWQAPVTIDWSTIRGGSKAVQTAEEAQDDTELTVLSTNEPTQYHGFDQAIIDEILRTFTAQQNAITELGGRLTALEAGVTGSLNLGSLVSLNSDAVTFLGDVRFSGAVIFDKPLILNKDSVGIVKVPAGMLESRIDFNKAFETIPLIQLTPNSFVTGQWRLSDVSESGFSVQLSEAQTQDVEYTWQAVMSKEQDAQQ